MADIEDKRVLVVKGMLFLTLALLAGAGVLLLAPDWRVALLLAVALWAGARFYYFLFYVLERYVDPRLKYAGIGALVRRLVTERRARDTTSSR